MGVVALEVLEVVVVLHVLKVLNVMEVVYVLEVVLALEGAEAAVVGLVCDVPGGAVSGTVGVGGEGPAQVRVPTQRVAGHHQLAGLGHSAHPGHSRATHGTVRVAVEVEVVHVVGPDGGGHTPVVQHEVACLERDLGHYHGHATPLQIECHQSLVFKEIAQWAIWG